MKVQEIKEFKIIRLKEGKLETVGDQVITEHFFTLIVDGRILTDFYCSPSNLEALVYGHLFSRGLIHNKKEVQCLSFTQNYDEALVTIAKENIGPVPAFTPRTGAEIIFEAETLFAAMDSLNHRAPLFAATAGAHGCSLHAGDKRIFTEDVGRHNAIDKTLGQAFLENWNFAESFLVTSGRISESVAQKMIRAGIPLIVSPSAPTDQAVDVARHSRLCLCGFTRSRRMNIYSGPKRIKI